MQVKKQIKFFLIFHCISFQFRECMKHIWKNLQKHGTTINVRADHGNLLLKMMFIRLGPINYYFIKVKDDERINCLFFLF